MDIHVHMDPAFREKSLIPRGAEQQVGTKD